VPPDPRLRFRSSWDDHRISRPAARGLARAFGKQVALRHAGPLSTTPMKFADLAPGRSITLGPETVSESAMVEFARAYDPQWFHVDAERAAQSTWEGLIASGWHTCCIAMRMVVNDVLAGSESFGSPGLAYLKWDNPVRPGDRLYVTLDVKERRVAKS